MFIQSCSKSSCSDTSDVINNYNVSAEDKSNIPFKGNDTLVYISNQGDTAKLIGTESKEFIETTFTNVSSTIDCPKYVYDKSETISFEYNGNNNELNRITYKIFMIKNETRIGYSIDNLLGSLNVYSLNQTSLYTSNVLVNNKNLFGVPKSLMDSIDFVYSKDYGFLKIQFKGGKTWLLNI
jgi:hypothetical protein